MGNAVKLDPTVCVVGNTYQIMVVVEEEALLSVKVGDKTYYHHSNGIRISSPGVHSFSVPEKELDREKKYTLIVQKMIERLPYFPKTEPPVEKTYNFRPITKTEGINIYHLADVHGLFSQAVNIVNGCKENIDLLIMNGDISPASDSFDDIILCYKIASEVTKGEIPCIISRGNHDLRGFQAENLAKYMPGDNGKSYYTVRVGCIWGILVDAGEDKNDDHPEYGGTVCCHDFRLEQEKMIEKTIENAKDEYEADGVKYRIVISHVPFTFKKSDEIFDIEKLLYTKWSRLIKENMHPDFMLCGHTHKALISEPGSDADELGQPCTVIVGSDVGKDEEEKSVLSGAFIRLSEGSAYVRMNSEHSVILEDTVKFD